MVRILNPCLGLLVACCASGSAATLLLKQPQVMLIGAEKSGSTSLATWLFEHPDVLGAQEGQHLVSCRHSRARLVKTLIKGGKAAGQMSGDRMRSMIREAGLTKEDIKNKSVTTIDQRGHPIYVIHELTRPIKLGGKEVRYWVPHVKGVIDQLASPDVHFQWYSEAFPAIPAEVTDDTPSHLRENFGKIAMDASPMYLDFEVGIPKQVRTYLPDAKLVVVLRDPVEGMWSHVKFHTSLGRGRSAQDSLKHLVKKLKQCVKPDQKHFDDDEISICLDQPFTKNEPRMDGERPVNPWGFMFRKVQYSNKIRAWNKEFPLAQLRVICSELLWENPVEHLRSLAQWLGLRDMEDDFWAKVSKTKHVPRIGSQGLTVEKHDNRAVTAERLPQVKSAPDKMRVYAESLFLRSNCELLSILGQNWTRFGWRYCDEWEKWEKGELKPAASRSGLTTGYEKEDYDYYYGAKEEL